MSSSMRPVERARHARRLRLLLAGLAVVPAPSAVHAATPVPLAPCRVGAIRLTHDMTLAALEASVRRAFPRAVLAEGKERGTAGQRRVAVRDGAEPLMTISYYGRTPARLVSRVDLTSPRFQLAPGIRPGAPLAAAARTLGPISLSYNPTAGVEDVNAPGMDAVLAGWEQAGCTANLRAGPGGKVGLYAAGAFETRRFRPDARISRIEIAL